MTAAVLPKAIISSTASAAGSGRRATERTQVGPGVLTAPSGGSVANSDAVAKVGPLDW